MDFTLEQEAEIQKRIDERTRLIALNENALTFMNISLNRSMQSGDRKEVYQAGLVIQDMILRPSNTEKKPEPTEDGSEE